VSVVSAGEADVTGFAAKACAIVGRDVSPLDAPLVAGALDVAGAAVAVPSMRPLRYIAAPAKSAGSKRKRASTNRSLERSALALFQLRPLCGLTG
jgi:hypothetical protein